MSVNWNPNDPENPNVTPAGGVDFGFPVQQGELSMVITRANGDVEDMGVVSYYDNNVMNQAKWELDTFGQVSPETEERLKVYFKQKAPYILLGIASAGLVGLTIYKKLR